MKIKKAKKDSKNVEGKTTKSSRLTADEKLKKLQAKRKLEAEKFAGIDNKENDPNSENGVSKYDSLAENLAGMMDKIASQLDIITRTVVTLERRIADNEELVTQAYDAYKSHQRQAISKALRLKEQEEREIADFQTKQLTSEDGKVFDPEDIEATREKVKNIMNIINISQYSLAAVQKSANDVRDTAKNLRVSLSII